MKLSKNVLCMLIGVAAATLSFSSCNSYTDDGQEALTAYVNPLIGTAHCRWFHFAPGALPFGLAKPASATNASVGNKGGWEATGYDYRDKTIEGFPCLHEFQIGGIVLMPTVGKLVTVPGPVNTTGKGYRSAFSHDDETAEPGYYSVMLKDYGVKAELTATKRVAYQRFTFPESGQSNLLFDIGNQQGESGKVVDAEVDITSEGLVEGWVETLPVYCNKYQNGATVKMFFSAEMDKSPSVVGTFRKNQTFVNQKHVKGAGAGAWLTYKTQKDETVTAKVGLSYTSVENARLNRITETNNGHLNFDEARRLSHNTWESYLGRIRVETPSEEDKTKFYTGLYHALLGRGIANDVNGAYPKHDGTIGQLPMKDGKPVFSFCNSDGIWGAQWNLIQVWALAYPDYLADYANTHIQVFKDSGWMGDGIANSRYVSGVGTNQLGNMLAAAYVCGIRGINADDAYAAARKNELDGTDRPLGAGKVDTDKFLKYGYVPHLDKGTGSDEAWMFSASHTLEYSFGAYAVAQMAKALGKTEDYNRLMDLSKGWERLYDPKLNLIHPRTADGRFIDDFKPMQVWRGFQEGNAFQYTFYVPHNPKGLIAKMGNKEFTERLDSIFTWSEKKIFSGGTTIDAFAGLQTYYNQGNQPCLHISWLFNQSGAPSLTQKWVRAILDKFYGTGGIHGYGYGQDEDQGQLGAWYVISSMGIFDVAGLCNINPKFSLGSPKFNRITIKLHPDYYKGSEFIIEAPGNSDTNKYAQRYTLNGRTITDLNLSFSAVTAGGKLVVEMGDTPKNNYRTPYS